MAHRLNPAEADGDLRRDAGLGSRAADGDDDDDGPRLSLVTRTRAFTWRAERARRRAATRVPRFSPRRAALLCAPGFCVARTTWSRCVAWR